MFKRTNHRRKALLIDSNQKQRRKPKLMRNRWLNFLFRLLFVKHVLRLFRLSMMVSLLLLAMLLFVLFAVFSPFFELKEINIVRDSPEINKEDIEAVLQPFYGQNILFLTDKEIQTPLKEAFPEFLSVTVSERWPDKIEVSVAVSEPLFTIYNRETANFSTISAHGIILTQSPSEELPVLHIYDYENLIPPQTVFLSKEQLQKIHETSAIVPEKIGVQIKEMRLFPTAKELHFELSSGTVLWFDLAQDMEEQTRKLSLAAERIGLYKDRLEHVDLRIPDHLFWK